MSGSEGWNKRGVVFRFLVHPFGTHLFAGFVWALFSVGQHAHQ
ncbi:DUF6126 family protein [Streptomyces sp. NPDC048484]